MPAASKQEVLNAVANPYVACDLLRHSRTVTLKLYFFSTKFGDLTSCLLAAFFMECSLGLDLGVCLCMCVCVYACAGACV